MLYKQSYLLEDFLKEFPDRNAFIDQNLKSSYDLKLRSNEPIEFLPNIPNEGSYPSILDKRKWEYSIAMTGILPSGRRSIVMIDGIQPYFLIEKPKCIVGVYPGEIPPGATPEQANAINETSKENFLNEVRSKLMGPDAPVYYSWETGKPFVGWQLEFTDYLRLTFAKQSSRKKIMTILRQQGYITYHDDYTDYYRVAARDYDIPLCSWTTIRNYRIDMVNNFKQPVIRVHVSDFVRYSGEVLKNPTLARDKSMICAWDIECATKSGNLPTAENKEDKLFMICATFHWWYSKNALVKICFVDQPTDEHKDYVTVVCRSEKNIILGFAYMFEKMKPDFCTGFNSSNFDYPWFVQRAYQYGILEIICDIMNEVKPFNGFDRDGPHLGHKLKSTTYDAWSRIELRKKIPKVNLNNYLAYVCPIYRAERVKIDAETCAEGTQLQFGGCISFDLMTIFRQLYPNSEKNSLDYFLTTNKLSGKKDMPVHELFRIYWEMTDLVNNAAQYFNLDANNDAKIEFLSRVEKARKSMREVAEYCVIDSFRCQELALMRNVIADKREVSALSDTSLPDAFFRANGMKVRQMVMKRGIERGLKFTTICKIEHGKDKYPGAYVVPPEKGLISSKLTLQERIEKHSNYTKKFGDKELNDGSYRTMPYKEIANFGNSNVEEIYKRAEDLLNNASTADPLDYDKSEEPEYVSADKPVTVSNYTEQFNSLCNIVVPLETKINEKLEQKIKLKEELLSVDKVTVKKITTFQKVIYDYAKENVEFTVVSCKPEYRKEVIQRTQRNLGGEILLSQHDIIIFDKFLEESTGRPITGLDFSSLYPSLIMTYNISPEYTISMETCNNSITTVKNRVMQAQSAGHKIRRIKFEYGDQKREVFGFFISHENQYPTIDDKKSPDYGKKNPNCKFGVYPSILKELFDQRSIMKIPKEYYEILNEHLDKLNDGQIKYNRVIRLCSCAFTEAINLNEFKDFETLFDEYEELKVLKDLQEFGNLVRTNNFSDFVGFMKTAPLEVEKISKITLTDAIKVIQDKVDFDHAYKPPRPKLDKEGKAIITTDAKIKKVLCAFEDEDIINAKGGISWEDIEFYFNYFDSKQKALKVFMNTFYGESGNKLSSMFVLAVAGSVTTQGQINLKRVIDFVRGNEVIDENGIKYKNSIGIYKVVYGDTDSAYIGAPEFVFRDLDIRYYSGQITKEQYWSQMVELSFVYIDKIKEEVNDMLKRSSGASFLKMAYEEVLFPVAFLAKKKYYGIPHISVPNFRPKKLFVRGLETKKRGVSGVLKDLCEGLMWKSMRIENTKELIELAYDSIEEFYAKIWNLEQFGKTAQYKPKSEEDIAEGKGNKSVLRFVERMKARGIEIKPHERFRYVIVRKYPYEYDYRGRKIPLKIGDFMELVEVAKREKMEIDIDYYMENGIIGQLARLVIYRDEFYVESLDDTDEEIKKADDASFKKAKKHLDYFASRYYKTYQDKGSVYKNTFSTIDKKLKETYRTQGLDKDHVDIICKDWEYENPDVFFQELSSNAEKKAIKNTKGYGKSYIEQLIHPCVFGVKPTDLTTLQRMYCGPNASQMKTVIEGYRNNLMIIERDFRNMFNDFQKLMNEHRRTINVMSVLVNKASGIDDLYNEPVPFDPTVLQAKLDRLEKDDEFDSTKLIFKLESLDNKEDNEVQSIKELAMQMFPHDAFNELFGKASRQITSSFNVRELSNRLLTISTDLYKTFLWYNQNLDVQSYIESQLDKKYHIATTPLSRSTTQSLIDEAVEEGLRDNLIDLDF